LNNLRYANVSVHPEIEEVEPRKLGAEFEVEEAGNKFTERFSKDKIWVVPIALKLILPNHTLHLDWGSWLALLGFRSGLITPRFQLLGWDFESENDIWPFKDLQLYLFGFIFNVGFDAHNEANVEGWQRVVDEKRGKTYRYRLNARSTLGFGPDKPQN